MKKLNIVFITEYYPPHIGGVETFFYELRKALLARGHNVKVLTSRQRGAKKETGVCRTWVPGFVDRYAFSFLSIFQAIKLSRDADIIHTTTYNAAFPAFIASKINKKPSVLTVHEVIAEDWPKIVKSPIKARVFEILEDLVWGLKFNSVVAVSKFTQDRLPKNLKKQSSVIYHGIDPIFSPSKEKIKDFNFLYYGRASINKGFWFLLEALPDFISQTKQKVKFKMVISGSKSEFEEADKFIEDKSLRSIVELKESLGKAGLVKELHKSYAVIVPSLAEGFGFTAAESASAGIPVIASNAGSLPELISGKYILFEKGSKNSLIKALNRALKGDWNIKKRREFSWEKAAKEYEDIYYKILQPGSI